MSGITFRSIKGANLTANEVDDNFRYSYVWSALLTYKAGMSVRFAFNDYECISDVTTPGTSPMSDPTHWKLVGGGAAYNTLQNNGSPITQRSVLNVKLPTGGTLADDSGNGASLLDLSAILPERHSDRLYDYSDTTNANIDLSWSSLRWPTGSTFLVGKTTGIYNFYFPTTGIIAGWTYKIITKLTSGPNNFYVYESTSGGPTSATLISGTGLFYHNSGLQLVLTFNGTSWRFHGEAITSYGGFSPTIQN